MNESGSQVKSVRVNWITAFFVLAAGSTAIALAGPESGRIESTSIPQPQVQKSLEERTAEALNLQACQVIQMDVDASMGQPVATFVTIDQQPYTLELQPHSIRAPGYQLLAQVEDGSIVPQDPGPDNTLRGRLLEVPGSQVAGGVYDGGLYAVVYMPDQTRVWVEPLAGRVEGAAENDYVVYRNEDVIPSGRICGVEDGAEPPIFQNEGDGNGGIAGSLLCAELGVDADFEYYVSYGQSVTNVQNRVNLVINTMNLQYENQCGIRHVITAIIVRTAEPDPYSSTSPGTLLNQFAFEWNTNQASIPRDLAHLFTGKNLSGGIIGIASLSAVCNVSNAYGLVQSDCCCCPVLSCATDLSAHEIGHNWSAQHCTSFCNSTMNSGLTCANTFLNSNPNSVTQITNYANSVGCLESCEDATTTLPFFDDFPSTTINIDLWTGVDGAASNTFGLQEPSPPNSLNLDGNSQGGDEVRSAIINPTGFTSFKLDYYYQRGGGGDVPETGDDLVFEYRNSAGNWVEVSRQFGGQPAMTTYQFVSLLFPPAAYHANFRLRIRCISSQSGLDDWFVDNVSMTALVAPGNNNCANGTIIPAGNHAFTTVGADTDGPNEPAACNFNGSTQIDNDVWFRYIAQCDGMATIGICGATFDSKMAVYGNCPTASGQTLACADNTCGDDPQVTIPVVFGQSYRIRIGGVNGATGTGTLSIVCNAQQPCPADINNSGSVDVADLLAVINAWGPCPGCPADIDDSGTVDVADLLAVINGWGACP